MFNTVTSLPVLQFDAIIVVPHQSDKIKIAIGHSDHHRMVTMVTSEPDQGRPVYIGKLGILPRAPTLGGAKILPSQFEVKQFPTTTSPGVLKSTGKGSGCVISVNILKTDCCGTNQFIHSSGKYCAGYFFDCIEF